MDLRDLIESFDIYKIGKAPVKYDPTRLDFLNQMHIRNMFFYINDNEK